MKNIIVLTFVPDMNFFGVSENLVSIFGGLRKWPDMITPVMKVNEVPPPWDTFYSSVDFLFDIKHYIVYSYTWNDEQKETQKCTYL